MRGLKNEKKGNLHKMSIHHSYAVFGLGRYGQAVAEELVKSGAEVIAVDKEQSKVNEASNYIPICKCADVTDQEVLERLGIRNVDAVIISMASSLEASVMAITLCKEIGGPRVIVKCRNKIHQKIFSSGGADKVVFPEEESGIRLAKNMLSSGFIDIIDISKNISIIEIEVQKEWVGKNLVSLNLRKKYSINVVAILKNDDLSIDVDPEMPLEKNMRLIVIGDLEKLSKLK